LLTNLEELVNEFAQLLTGIYSLILKLSQYLRSVTQMGSRRSPGTHKSVGLMSLLAKLVETVTDRLSETQE